MYAEIFGRHFRPTFRFGTTSCTDCFDNTAGTKITVFMNHPIDSLMIESGQLFELEGERRGNPYMDTPTIQVIQKAGLEPVTSSEYKYSFLLNHNTCPVWREIFGIHVLSPEVKFEGNKNVL